MIYSRFSVVVLVVVCAVCCVGFGPCSAPSPLPDSAGAKIASAFVAEYRAELGKVFYDAGKLVKAGELKTDAELLEYLQRGSENARKQAAAPLDEYLERNLSDGELRRSDGEVMAEIAAGLGVK